MFVLESITYTHWVGSLRVRAIICLAIISANFKQNLSRNDYFQPCQCLDYIVAISQCVA